MIHIIKQGGEYKYMKIVNVVLGIFLILFSAAMFYISLGIPRGAAMLPRFVLLIIVLLSVALMFEKKIESKPAEKESEKTIGDSAEEPENEAVIEVIDQRRSLLLGILTLLYIVLINPLGYFIVTPIYIITALISFNVRKPAVVLGITIGFTALMYYGFYDLLNVRLPMGILG